MTNESATANLKSADETTTSGESVPHAPESTLASAAPSSAATASIASHSATPTSAATSLPRNSETSKANNSEPATKPSIGSAAWFATAIPFGNRKIGEPVVEEPLSAVSGAEQEKAVESPPVLAGITPGVSGAAATSEVAAPSREVEEVAKPSEPSGPMPPNHLGENVPAAPAAVISSTPTMLPQTADMAPEQSQPVVPASQPVPATTTPNPTLTAPNLATTDRAPSTVAPTDTTSKAPEPVPVQPHSGGLFSNPFGSDERQDMTTVKDKPKPTVAAPQEPKEVQSKGIPTAGGVAVGAYAAEERRKSRDVRSSMSGVQPGDVPAHPQDERTTANTAANADIGSPRGPSSPATPVMVPVRSADNVDSPGSATGGKEKKKGLFSKVKEKIKH